MRELTGCPGAQVLASLGVELSPHTTLSALLRLPMPERPVSVVVRVDDFGHRKRKRYATVRGPEVQVS